MAVGLCTHYLAVCAGIREVLVCDCNSSPESLNPNPKLRHGDHEALPNTAWMMDKKPHHPR